MKGQKSNLDFITSTNMALVVKKYVAVNELYADDTVPNWQLENIPFEENSTKIINEILENVGGDLKRFCTEQEFATNIKLFREMLGDIWYFEYPIEEPYTRNPSLTPNPLNKNTRLLSKHDIYPLIQLKLFSLFEESNETASKLFRSMISIFLKNENTNRIRRTIEFVQMEGEVESMLSSLENLMSTKETEIEPADASSPSLFDSLRVFLPDSLDDAILEKLKNEFECIDNFHTRKSLFKNVGKTIMALKHVFEAFPNVFLPRKEVEENKKSLPIIRLFIEPYKSFCISAEIDLNPDNQEELARKEKFAALGIYETVHFSEVQQSEPFKKNRIQLFPTGLIRTTHCSVPFMVASGEFAKRGDDILIDFLRSMISGKRTFCRMRDSNDWALVSEFFKKLEKVLICTGRPYVMEIEQFYTKADWQTFCDRSKYLDERSVENVRNCKISRFTLPDLRKQLRDLSLFQEAGFSDMRDVTELVFKEMRTRKKDGAEYLESDLLDAVDRCQFIAFLRKFPYFQKFLHEQQACDRMLPLKCESCHSEKSDSNKSKKKKKNGKQSGPPQPSASTAPVRANSPQKESAVCDKCHRTMQYCENAKQQKREVEIELRAVKKELKAFKDGKKQEDLENELKRVKEQLAQEVAKSSENKQIIEESLSANSILEAKLKEQSKTIKTLERALATKDTRIRELESPECPICLVGFGRQMPCCNQVFHDECIATWERSTMPRPTCPHCRTEMLDWPRLQ